MTKIVQTAGNLRKIENLEQRMICIIFVQLANYGRFFHNHFLNRKIFFKDNPCTHANLGCINFILHKTGATKVNIRIHRKLLEHILLAVCAERRKLSLAYRVFASKNSQD